MGEMDVAVEGEESLCVKFSDTEQSDDENIAILPENAFKIDLAPWMYEYVAVAIPMQHVHPEDENGNSTCDPEMLKYITSEEDEIEEAGHGEETDEVDPRWAKLLDLK